MARIIDGKILAEKISADLRDFFKIHQAKLAIVEIGSNPASDAFLKRKKDAAEALGIDCRIFSFSEDVSSKKLRQEIFNIAKSGSINGLLIQLPIPKKINCRKILNAIPVEKDIDVLTEKNFGAFCLGSDFLPPSVSVLEKILEDLNFDVSGKTVAILGAGRLVGLPISIFLSRKKADILWISENSVDPALICQKADLIICGTGQPELIRENWLKSGVVVIDFGCGQKNGKITGDLEKSAVEKAGFYTPTPGGTGPILIACLFENLKRLMERKIKN